MRWLPFVILVIASLVSLWIVFSNFRNTRYFKLIVLAVIYFTGLGIILFTPISFDGRSIYFMEEGIGRVNKTRLYLHGLGFIENIILTIPLGMILKKFVPQLPIAILGLIGLILSGGIEIVQYYLSQNFLINRSSDINDVIANTVGVIIGCFVVMAFKRLESNKI